MGKFRSKLKGQSKGKRWPKGQSSSSNPETRKYRDLAKSRFFQEVGNSNLTLEALSKHNAVQSWISTPKVDDTNMEDDSESYASSYKTTDTFASDWTNCTNMSYSRFLKVFRSDSAIHKEMLSILAAITEVIKENGGNESPVEYYCALLTTLEQVSAEEQKKEEQITAILSLLNMGIKKVPPSVLCSGFSSVTKLLLTVLNNYSQTENNIVMKSIFGILAEFIKNQEIVAWEHADLVQVFHTILNPFSIHTRAKWRREAQKAVSSVVVSISLKEINHNPAADKVAEFCQITLNSCLGGNSGNVLVSSIQAGQTTILHTLGLMKLTIPYYSKTNLKKCCELLLRLMSLNYPLVTSCSMQAFHALFTNQKAVMSSQLNAQLVTALYDYQPSLQDLQPTLAWIAVMQQAHVHLADIDLSTCCMALPKIFKSLTQLWLSEKHEIMSSTTNALKTLLEDAIGPITSSEQLVNENRWKLIKCFQVIESSLGYQYHSVWHQVLHVISKMFEVAGLHCSDMFTDCLKSLVELRDSYKFSYNNELEHAVGSAVRYMGPEVVLSIISLKRDNGELNLERSWLLPVLKENVRNTSLNFWFTNIFPLAVYCQKRSIELAESNDGIGSHSAELLHLQLWNLLPSFCNNPKDVKDSFRSIAKTLGTAIAERKELRLAVMASLRKLINNAKEENNIEDLEEMGRFDKNYLPILFNVYTTKSVGTDEDGQRLAALDTIKAFLTISRPELTEQLFENAFEKMQPPDDRATTKPTSDECFLKESLMDLIRALIPYQKLKNISLLYEKCIKNLPGIQNGKEQKKSYRLLEEICSCESDGCKQFRKNNRKTILRLLSKSLESSAVSSKGARLRCFNYLLQEQQQLTHESKFIKSVISEAVICCKDINEKCRATAYNLLNNIGETLIKHNEIEQFLGMLLAGLVGTPQMMSATILALSSVLHNFSGILGQENIHCLIENIAKLMSAPTREIVASCLSFIKVYCATLPSPVVAASLPVLMSGLTNMTDDCKRHMRIKIRDILDRLVRKYGCDALTPHIPISDTVMYKRLRNLRKLNVRKKRMKERRKEEDDDSTYDEFVIDSKHKSVNEILADSDSEDDMEIDDELNTKSGNSKKSETWIEEDGDTIVDFTDPSARTKIIATKRDNKLPQMADIKKKKNNDRGFKTSSDGRLIIEQADSSEDEIKLKQTDDYSDSDNDGDDAETVLLTDRKRKRDNMSVKSGVSSQIPTKYKPGGKGIHRTLSAAGSSVAGSEYKSKKSQGDVKKKGKFDPYAYLPLKRSTLNKRKKLKNVGQFKNIIKGAKAGARKGTKIKRLRK